jgi:hypothetical protein
VDDKPSTIFSGSVATGRSAGDHRTAGAGGCAARTSRCTSVPTGEGRGLRIALRYCR